MLTAKLNLDKDVVMFKHMITKILQLYCESQDFILDSA